MRSRSATPRLLAPFTGVISVREAELGQLAGPGVAIFTLDDLDHVWLRAYVNEPDIGKVRLGEPVDVTTDTYPGKVYHGRISFISPEAEFTPENRRDARRTGDAGLSDPHRHRQSEPRAAAGMPADASIAAVAVRQMTDVDGAPSSRARPDPQLRAGHGGAAGSTFAVTARRDLRPRRSGRRRQKHDHAHARRRAAADAGAIAWTARCRRRSRSARPYLSYMPQRFGLYEDLTVDENIFFYADAVRGAACGAPARGPELLEAAGLLPFRRRLAGQLSGGMKQKLGLVCALIHTPQVLLLDEPTTGVDPVSRRDFWAILYGLREHGVTILLSTAYMDEAERCSRLALVSARRDPPLRHARAAETVDAGRAAGGDDSGCPRRLRRAGRRARRSRACC